METLLLILLLLTGLVMLFIILIQRGRGGGLVGALGGQGGASAFGSRAGDTFTRITVGVALVWLVLNMAMNLYVQYDSTPAGVGSGTPTTQPTQPTKSID